MTINRQLRKRNLGFEKYNKDASITKFYFYCYRRFHHSYFHLYLVISFRIALKMGWKHKIKLYASAKDNGDLILKERPNLQLRFLRYNKNSEIATFYQYLREKVSGSGKKVNFYSQVVRLNLRLAFRLGWANKQLIKMEIKGDSLILSPIKKEKAKIN